MELVKILERSEKALRKIKLRDEDSGGIYYSVLEAVRTVEVTRQTFLRRIKKGYVSGVVRDRFSSKFYVSEEIVEQLKLGNRLVLAHT